MLHKSEAEVITRRRACSPARLKNSVLWSDTSSNDPESAQIFCKPAKFFTSTLQETQCKIIVDHLC